MDATGDEHPVCPPTYLSIYKTVSYAPIWVTFYTTFCTTINDLFEAFDKRVPWWAKETPATLANHRASKERSKGPIVVVLVPSGF